MTTFKKIYAVIFFILFFSWSYGQLIDDTIKIKRTYTSEWVKMPVKLLGLEEKKIEPREDFTRYGSYKHLRTESTGFYYVKKINERWWVIDPDGYAGINMAVTSVGKDDVINDYNVIVKNGFNGIGNFVTDENQTDSVYNRQNEIQLSYTRKLNFFLNYQKVRHKYYATPENIVKSLNYIYVLDPEFEKYCFELAKNKVLPFAQERNLLGWFTDNEINFNQDQLKNLIKDLPEEDPSRNAALAFAKSKGLTEYDCVNYTAKVTEKIKEEFAVLLAEHYYKTVSSAIRKYDQNHLILGSRLNGRPRAIQAVVNASHKYMDVTSVNFYDRLSPNEQITLQSWTNDYPCLVGEFYTKDINVYDFPQSGTGFYVNSQTDRGKFYQNTCLQLLRNKCFIGWHYFRFIDNTDSNKGIVNTQKQEYTDMTKYMRELNDNVYRICNYFDKKTAVNHKTLVDSFSGNIKLNEHPRLFFLKSEEAKLKKKIASEKTLSDVHNLILSESKQIIKLPVLTRNQVGRRILHTSREAIRRILYLSYSYRMTGKKIYFERAQKEMLNLAAFDNWNPTHFLDVAEMTLALSIGYDWLYDRITPENRTKIQQAILNNGIRPSTNEKYNKWLMKTSNWNQVCNGGISAGIVALFETNPEEFAPFMNRAISSIPLALNEYANNGAYPEGYHYWDYGTTYNLLLLDMLNQNWNSDFGLKEHAGFMETAVFMQNMEGFFLPLKNGNYSYPLCFNYADGSDHTSVNPAMFWFASENKNSALIFNEFKKLKIDLELNKQNLLNNRFLPFLLLWSRNIDFKNIALPDRKMFVSNGNTEIAMMRTSWVDNSGIYVGVKGGTPSTSHQHMDVGSFIMEANGVRWALDFGNQEYNSLESKGIDLWNFTQNSERWDVFRYKNSSHNTLIINNQKQRVKGNAIIKAISETDNNMAVWMDLTSLYKTDVKMITRKVSLLDKQNVQTEDSVTTLDKDVVVRWNMLTEATPRIIDHHTIELTQAGKKLMVELTDIEGAKAYISSTVSPNGYDASNVGTSFIGFDISIAANSTKQFIVNLAPVK